MQDLADGLMEDKMMIIRTRMRLGVLAQTKEEEIPIISMIKTIDIIEEEEEGKDLE